MEDKYLEMVRLYRFSTRHGHRYKKCLITKNMGLLLDALLSSLTFTDGELRFQPSARQQAVLNTFTLYDVIDCFDRLQLDHIRYSAGKSNTSKAYVLDKMIKLREAYNRSKKEKD